MRRFGSIFLMMLLTFSYQVTASQRSIKSESYKKLAGIIRQNILVNPHKPHDLTEYGAKVLVSKDDVYGDPEEILELSGEVYTLYAALPEQEKAIFPPILMSEPGTFAMKYSSSYCGDVKVYITRTQPTEEDLDRQSHNIKFV